MVKDNHELLILLPFPPKFYDYECVLHTLIMGLGIHLRMLGKHSINRVTSPVPIIPFHMVTKEVGPMG